MWGHQCEGAHSSVLLSWSTVLGWHPIRKSELAKVHATQQEGVKLGRKANLRAGARGQWWREERQGSGSACGGPGGTAGQGHLG